MAIRLLGRLAALLTLLPIGTAFVVPAHESRQRSISWKEAEKSLIPQAQAHVARSRSDWSSSAGVAFAAASLAAIGAARSAMRHGPARRHGRRRGSTAMLRKATVGVTEGAEEELSSEIVTGAVDPETGQKNYVNPWEEVVDGYTSEDCTFEKGKFEYGWSWHKYEGPVYKKVPVVEGLKFPLDPAVYQEPLEPPPPGGAWGDGRSADGNWYLDMDGEQVEYWQGVGMRRRAHAVVRITKGTGQFIINGVEAYKYFSWHILYWLKAIEPLAALKMKNSFDVICKVFGSGPSTQAGAIRRALSIAICEYDFNARPLLRRGAYILPDYRFREPQKPGQPGPRAKKPYHKR